MSKGEEKIIRLLQKSHYKFEREKRFADLKKGRYRFDFYIYRHGGPVIVEFQGQQHYQAVDYCGGEDSYRAQIERDVQFQILSNQSLEKRQRLAEKKNLTERLKIWYTIIERDKKNK